MNTEKISPKHTHPFAINQQKTNEGGDSRAAGRAGLAGFGGAVSCLRIARRAFAGMDSSS